MLQMTLYATGVMALGCPMRVRPHDPNGFPDMPEFFFLRLVRPKARRLFLNLTRTGWGKKTILPKACELTKKNGRKEGKQEEMKQKKTYN